jgi:hypothetical protein
MGDDEIEAAMQELSDFSDLFQKAMNDIKEDREAYWNSLTKDQQLKCFCAVVDRIVQGESEGRSYRCILYSVFGFGPESYAQAQMSGFLELHNSIADIRKIT